VSFLLSCVVLRTVFVLTFYHWFIIWVSLEVGTFSMVPILFVRGGSRKVEACLKYFLVSVVSALILLGGSVMVFIEAGGWSLERVSVSGFWVILVALLIKLGLSPFHYWFPEVIQGVGFLQGLLVSTWQKISPLYLVVMTSSKVGGEVILLVGACSVLVGG